MESAFDEWKNLFSDSAETVWYKEIKELRKFAMIIHILGTEMTKIERLASSKLELYREQLMDIPKTLTPGLKQKKGTPLSVISRSNITKQSYISPDMFNLDSPLSATIGSKLNEQVTELATDDEDVIIQTQKAESPKISCKSRKYLQMKRNQRSQNKPKTPVKQKLFADEIIENTPINISKTRIRSQFKKKFGNTFSSTVTQKLEKTKELAKEDDSTIYEDKSMRVDDFEMVQKPRSQFRKKCENSYNNSITQKLEKTRELPNEDDSEATIYGDFVDKSMRVDDIIEMVQKANVTSNTSQLEKVQETKPKHKSPGKCRTCDHPRRYCAKHDSQNHTLAENTFTGLWDLDFNVNNSGLATDKSTIYF